MHIALYFWLLIAAFSGLQLVKAFVAKPMASSNIVSCRSGFLLMSTIISPPKVDKKTKKDKSIEPNIPDFIFKENRDIQKEFEEYFDDEKFYVVLYNDPYNKRQFVQQVLMEVLSFSEAVARDTMMQAHTYGFAVVGEWAKEVAEDYAKQLVERGLVAEAKSSKDSTDS